MAQLNPHFSKLQTGYLFPQIEKRVARLSKECPSASILNLGIGDVTSPLPPALLNALRAATEEMGDSKGFRGYGPSQGYPFLRNSIAEIDYKNLEISSDEIFIGDGAKGVLGSIQEFFAPNTRVAMCNPSYPVYQGTTVLAGNTKGLLETGEYDGICYLPCTKVTGFVPEPPNQSCDLIYLCSPHNPTGVAMNRTLLQRWVDYAQMHNAVIVYDGAYESFITSPDCPRSIYEIPGAQEVAIEVRSFSKRAGLSGLRCSYTVIPYKLKAMLKSSTRSLHELWRQRTDLKYGGTSYPVQRVAASIYSLEGMKEIEEMGSACMERSFELRQGLSDLGFEVAGGIDAPYIWCKTPGNHSSWSFFEHLLETVHVLTIPGSGFGKDGEGYIRFSAFANGATIKESLQRLRTLSCKSL